MTSTLMDLDRPERGGANGPLLNINRTLGSAPPVSNLCDVVSTFRPTKVVHRPCVSRQRCVVSSAADGGLGPLQLLRREDIKDGRPQPHVLSIDYDDDGELLMTSSSDETIHIYGVKEGRHEKSLLSKKYGVKLAKFTHTSSSIIYASTKQNSEHPPPPRRHAYWY